MPPAKARIAVDHDLRRFAEAESDPGSTQRSWLPPPVPPVPGTGTRYQYQVPVPGTGPQATRFHSASGPAPRLRARRDAGTGMIAASSRSRPIRGVGGAGRTASGAAMGCPRSTELLPVGVRGRRIGSSAGSVVAPRSRARQTGAGSGHVEPIPGTEPGGGFRNPLGRRTAVPGARPGESTFSGSPVCSVLYVATCGASPPSSAA
jgi:hypothetical protein